MPTTEVQQTKLSAFAELKERHLAQPAFQPSMLLALPTLSQARFFLPLSTTKFLVTQHMDLDCLQGFLCTGVSLGSVRAGVKLFITFTPCSNTSTGQSSGMFLEPRELLCLEPAWHWSLEVFSDPLSHYVLTITLWHGKHQSHFTNEKKTTKGFQRQDQMYSISLNTIQIFSPI